MSQRPLKPSPHEPLRCLLVSPEFPKQSFWNWRKVCRMRGHKAMAMPLGLVTLAAILPQNWQFKLLDMNTTRLRDRHLRWADLVCISGMAIQQIGILAVMRRAQQLGKFVAVGGPDPIAQASVYRDADALVLGEGETTVPLWLDAWQKGSPRGIFRQPAVPDLTASPTPRFDLVHLGDTP